MKRKKGLLLFLPVVLILLLQLPVFASTQSQNAKKAYAAQLAKSRISFEGVASVPTSIMSFCLVDFDNNGIPELYVHTGQAGGLEQYKMYIGNSEIWSYESGQLVQHRGDQIGLDDLHGLTLQKYYPSKGIYYVDGGFKMMGWEKYIRYQNGKSTVVAKHYSNGGYPDASHTTDEYYNTAGTQISKSAYDTLVKSLISGAAVVEVPYSDLKTNTSSNRSTYILNRTLPSEQPDIGTPALVSATNLRGGISVQWKKAANANGYNIYRSVNGGGWSKINSVKGNATTSYTDTNVTSGTTYKYTVRGYRGTILSGYDNTGKTIVRLNTPVLQGTFNSSKGIQVTWAKVPGAAGYNIYRKTASTSWKQVGTVNSGTTLFFMDTGVKEAYDQTFTYTVRAKKGSYLSGYSTVGKTMYRLRPPLLRSVVNVSGGKAAVTWKKVSASNGYEIQYSEKADFSSYKSIKLGGTGTVTGTVSGLTKGKGYYVRVRAYKTISGRTDYGVFSGQLYVKITK